MHLGKTLPRTMLSCTAAVLLALSPMSANIPAFAASQVSAVVNATAITSGDVAKRVNFLKLQRQKGDLSKLARQQLVDEVLKREEVLRVKTSVSTEEVDAAFGRFAANNKMTAPQLTQVLDKAGVTAEHFKSYIAISMSWPRAVSARFGSGNSSKDDLISRMQQSKDKPVTTEYFLQQIIFVIPASKRNAISGKRKAEAEASRAKFPGCDQSKVFAATMHDVSVRSLGRVMAPQLPEEWKPLVEKAQGMTTGTRVTERGVEYLAICKQRQVNDDQAAEVVYQAEDLLKKQNTTSDPNEEKYLQELRSKAQISYP